MTTTARPAAAESPAAPLAPDTTGIRGLLPITLRLPEAVLAAGPDACEAWFVALTLANPDCPWVIELNAAGELELTMPPFAPYDKQEMKFVVGLENWNTAGGKELGTVTGSSGGYRLPNGSIRYPDAAWSPQNKVIPPPIDPPRARPYCPDFVVEIRSGRQPLNDLQGKMREYMDNGALLGWLIDSRERTVRIYRAGVAEPELLPDPETLDGGDVLPGFVFPVRRLIFDLA